MWYVGGLDWKKLLQRLVVGAFASVPATVWAPNDLAKNDILEVVLEYRILKEDGSARSQLSGQRFLSSGQAESVTQFLNAQFHDRGLRFVPAYVESIAKDARLGGVHSKGELLKSLERYSQPGRITVVVPAEAKFSTTYLAQPLSSGPFAVFNGEGGQLEIARQVGQILGFTKVCDQASNIMFQHCPSHTAPSSLASLELTYFTKDGTAQSFPQQLHLWKWEATSYLMERREQNLAERMIETKSTL